MPALSQSPPPRRRTTPRRASVSPSRDTGVKGITRKVIRHLEGLGHLVEGDVDEEMDDESEVAESLKEDRRAGKRPAPPQPKKIDWEIPRKVFHSSIGFLTGGLYLTPSISPRDVAIGLWAALSFIGSADVVRLRNADFERLYERVLGFLMRESERHGTNGTVWYILGVNFALTFYPIDVATVAILMCVISPTHPHLTRPFSLLFTPYLALSLKAMSLYFFRLTGALTNLRALRALLSELPIFVFPAAFIFTDDVSIFSLSWADTAASTIGRMYGPRTPPLPTSMSLSWLPSWVWVPRFLLVTPPTVQANGHVKGNPKPPQLARRLRLPFAPRKSTAGFIAACITGSLVALVFWVGIAGWNIRGVAEMRAVAEGAPGVATNYHSQYSIAGQYIRSASGAWVRNWVPEGVIGGVAGAYDPTAGAKTTPARFGVGGWAGLLAVTLFAGIVSGIAEALDLGGLDDNLTLPIISGGALMAFFRVWGWMVGR
ncbi:hypothetical protein MIND_01317800 [Mycena indigotica]|uniref:Phosphatidate cytidylyltransferase n=1 Tax=Mycena indigotica TaxID=2126181 RepID=A0A8H6VWH4_9AGAR|nr:uncharacterized protein MIND_01317800 [Mycena indigotica]KAF7290769.1 hypothetical protein MIND_01317800 [Mycena indigotica]